MLVIQSLIFALLVAVVAYFTYQRFVHPLHSFPGPFIASVTNFWRFYHELRGDLPNVIHKYHVQYGSFIRVAPDEINTDDPEVIDTVYKMGGRHYIKSPFYNGFTAIRPNIFGTRDEELHSLRRRQMAHAFSQANLIKMEYIFDRHVIKLLEKLDKRAEAGKAFPLEDILRFYSQDCNGDLSLGVQFGTQDTDNPSLLPPLNDHIALAKLTGYVPWIKPIFDRFGRSIPWPYLQRLLSSRAWMRREAERVTDLEFKRAGRSIDKHSSDVKEEKEPSRINLFTSLVCAKDPETGEYIERDDITSNVITFLTAGSHSTASTLEILFWYLVHYPQVLENVQGELDRTFEGPTSNEHVESCAGLEEKLPYTSAFFYECFRLSPTFQHPAPKISPTNASNPRYPSVISGTIIPPGYAVSASVLSLHRNSHVWGADAEQFRPERWFEPETKSKKGLLMHFGQGHRSCIGRNQSLVMLWKAMVEVLRRFEISLVSDEDRRQKEIQLRVCGFAELAKPLVVKAQRRV